MPAFIITYIYNAIMKILFLINFLIISSLSIAQNAPRYKMIKSDPYKNFSKCNAGGFLYKGNYIQATNLYKDFKKDNPLCTNKKTFAKGKLNQSAQEVHEMAQELVNDKQCPELQAIAKDFLFNEKNTKDKVRDDTDAIKQIVKNDASKHKIQVEASFLAWGYYLCDAGFLGQSLSDRLDMYNAIKGLKFSNPPIKVKTEGDIIESCQNVTAEGPDVAWKFGLKVKDAPENNLKMSYHTYSVKDRITVKDKFGNSIADIGCVQTKITQEIEIPISGKDIIYFEVEPDCEGSGGSNWIINLSCGVAKIENLTEEQRERRSYCQELATDMMEVIQKNTELIFAGQQFRWLAANCYEDHYKKMAKDYTNMIDTKSFFTTSGNTKMRLRDVPITKNELKVKPIELSVKKNIYTPPPKRQHPFVYDYDDFIRNQKRYCLKEPNEKMPLFKRISSAYCHYGFPRLFKPEQKADIEL